jgi:starch-binding outer membrane protein, SusD/RagB family
MKKYPLLIAICALALMSVGVGCEKEYLNPSTASEQEIVKDVNGLIALCNGLQFRYTVSRRSPVYAGIAANGCTTLELDVLNAGNTDENNLTIGGNAVLGNNAVVTNLWEQSNLVKANADLILVNARNVGDLGTRSGIVAYASIFKALSLGNLAMYWEKAPIDVVEKANFESRTAVLQAAISALEAAKTDVASNPVSAYFTARIAPGIDIPNTINALLARYHNMLGNHDAALAAAGAVDLAKKSEFRYDDISQNPIFFVALSNINVFQPVDTLLGLPAALAPDPADKRILFYLQSKTATNNVYRGKGFFTSNSSPIPVYLPDEMTLIKAECFARKDMLTEGQDELNKVLTGTTDTYNVLAGLPAISTPLSKDELLTQIYRNRCIELFMSGLKLEDSRRFGRQASTTNLTERNRNFYPYPTNERDNNSNTPADPAF